MTSIFKSWKAGAVLLTDAGWGDSGKGKVVSALGPEIAAKIIGGHNAGHTIVNDLGTFGLGLTPSTISLPRCLSIIGQEVVINPVFLIEEIKNLKKRGISISPKNLMLDARSHLVMPWHETRDALSEEARGKAAIGSLHLGVGWTYSDRINRRGLRLMDLLAPDWKERIAKEMKNQTWVLEDMQKDVKRKTGKRSVVKAALSRKKIFEIAKKTRRFLTSFTDNTTEIVWKALAQNKKVLFEDSHGGMLDVSHGSWPFTTGVNTSFGGLHRSFGGKAVRAVVRVVVAIKAYQTRVGGGPMPTEDLGKFGSYVRERGGEVGTRSGRARRCGAFDIPLLKYGLKIVGAGKNDEIALTKLDVLSGLKKIPICIAYQFKGKTYREAPHADAEFLYQVRSQVVYLSGWKEDISSLRKFKDLPESAQKYVLFIEKLLGTKITFIGTGKHKDDMILR